MADTTDARACHGRPRVLIINADDFGMSAGINRGILEAVAAGVVTSASLMVNMPASDDATHAACAVGSSLSVGLHLTLTAGRPLTTAESLVDPETGEFFPLPRLLVRALGGQIRSGSVVEECQAQIARLRGAGLKITHLDGHQHVHVLPVIAGAVRRVVARENIPVVRRPAEALLRGDHWWRRLPQRFVIRTLSLGAWMRPWPAATTDHFMGGTLLGAPDFEAALVRLLDHLPPGTTELMVHPGYARAPLPGNDAYVVQREAELRALLSPAVRARLDSNRIALISFAQLRPT